MIIPFVAAHVEELRDRIQAGQEDTAMSTAHGEVFEKGHCAWTCVNVKFDAVAAAGILPVWKGRGLAWALISADAGPHMREITLATLEALDACRCTRVELYAKPGFHAAFRWARMLGFEFEAILEGADPSGGDMAIFKRIRGKSNGFRTARNGRVFRSRHRIRGYAGGGE